MTYLVTGATGNVGRHIVTQLLEAGAPVRALTRDPSRAGLPDGVEVVAGDLTRLETLPAAFEGVTAAHLINFGGDDYALLPDGARIVELLEAAGVKRVTLLGAWDYGSVDEAVAASALTWTRVSGGEYMSNALSWAEAVRTTGAVAEPFVDGQSPMTHEGDIAAAVVAVLLDDGHHGESIQVTAPRSISLRDKIRVIGEAIGRDITLTELTPQQSRERDEAAGEAPHLIDFKLEVFGGLPTQPYPLEGAATFESLTGRKPRDFAQWAVENAAAFKG